MAARRSQSRALSVRLLGRIDVVAEGTPVRLGGRQAQALFALLTLDRRPRSRDAIAADLWPEAAGAAAGCLRQALWLVRTGLASAGVDADDVLEIEPDLVGLRPAARIDVDVARFEAAMRARPTDVEAALASYDGDLLEGLGHECFAAERERLSDAFEDALAIATERRLAAGQLQLARDAAEKLLARDPLREEAHAALITVFGETGSRSQVTRQYRRLQEVLRRELDVEPLPETVAAYRAAMAATYARSQAMAAPGRGLVRSVRTQLAVSA
jgi:DNA-binding SARP family transcriptional activator